jgi:hypothetical protein
VEKPVLPKPFYKRALYYLIIAGIAIIGTVATLYIQSTVKPADDSQSQTVVAASDPAYVEYTAVTGKTSMEQLKESATNVQTKTTEYGEYVDGIGELVGGTDGKYWSFYIDGTLASVGAGSYTQKGSEKIEWKFENLLQQ